MSQPPQDPHIPTLTQVVKPAAPSRPAHDKASSDAPPQPAEPVVPSPGPLPQDLNIDFSLEALDEPGHGEPEQERPISLAPPGFLEVLQLPPTSRPTPPEPASADLHARIEAAVDEALAAQLPELRKRLVDTVLKTLSQSGNLPGA